MSRQRTLLLDALGQSWKKRLIATKAALIDGEAPLKEAGLDGRALSEVIDVVSKLLEDRPRSSE